MTWSEVRRCAERRLEAAGVDNAHAEARWLVEHVAGLDAAAIVASPVVVPTGRLEAVEGMLDRRLAGEPLQYVLGEWSFRGLELGVDRRVLIPRPETEVTAQVAIDELREGHSGVVVDLGTGSGAIALALASEVPGAEVWATDVNADALAVARANLVRVGSLAARVHLVEGDWFDALPTELRSRVRLVVSNPPYLASHELATLAAHVQDYEPAGALVSGPSGLEAIERIVAEAPSWLMPDGVVVCELAPHQAPAAIELATGHGFAEVRVEADLTGRDRVLVARLA